MSTPDAKEVFVVEWLHPDGTWHIDRDLTEKMGWCIPTLLISHAGRRAPAGTSDRTYAITLDGKPVRIGRGPHVKRIVHVYVRQSRLPALQHYLTLQQQGAEVSNQIRDRISSRRAQGQLMRQQGRTSWRWDI